MFHSYKSWSNPELTNFEIDYIKANIFLETRFWTRLLDHYLLTSLIDYVIHSWILQLTLGVMLKRVFICSLLLVQLNRLVINKLWLLNEVEDFYHFRYPTFLWKQNGWIYQSLSCEIDVMSCILEGIAIIRKSANSS